MEEVTQHHCHHEADLAVLNEKMDRVVDGLSENTQLTKDLVTVMVEQKNNRVDINDHEKRLRVVENRTIFWSGGLAVIAIGLPLLLKYVL